MNLRETAGRLDRLQKSRRVKIIATVLIAALAIAGYAAWWIVLHAPSDEPIAAATAPREDRPAVSPSPGTNDADIAARPDDQALIEQRVSAEELRLLLGRRDASATVAAGTFAVAGVAVAIVWLGLGLTFLALSVVAGIVAAPLLAFEGTRTFGQVILGMVVLTAAFTALMEGMRLALSPSAPVTAIARTCLSEAVRMKISLVFIVLLIFMLATLPGLLDESQPLRYRVQSFLQYSVGGSYWVLAVMTLFFSAATVAFEQRDRIIWQTMAKPVRPWEYVLGKWLGIAALNAALLAVAGTGAFLFTEHLRGLPANEESRPYVNADGSGQPTTDRLLLASQVLVARSGAQPVIPPTPQAALLEQTQRIVNLAKERDPSLGANPERLERLTLEVYEQQVQEWREQLRTIGPGQAGTFEFQGLEHARTAGKPLTVRYKIQAGGNNPTALYRLTFRVSGVALPSVQATLNTAQRLPIRPEAIEPGGRLVIDVFNGDPFTGETNPLSITFPPGDLEVLYVAGGYEVNFVRVLVALWIKLGFIAAVGIAAATFLSFPVACLMGIMVLFAGESATFLMQSLEDFHFRPKEDGPIEWTNVPIRLIALPIALAFQDYAKLDPAANLVDGRLVSWTTVLRSLAVVGTWSAGVLAIGWAIFRKRELALYSGH